MIAVARTVSLGTGCPVVGPLLGRRTSTSISIQTMGLLDSILAAVGGTTSDSARGNADNPLLAALGGLLQQNGGVQGLLEQFSKNGLGDLVSSWVGMGENKAVSPEQIHSALGSEQITKLASSLGIDAQQASSMLSQYLPKIIDKLTPAGQIDSGADSQQGLAALLPSLLESGVGKILGGGGSQQA
jgi:uncharacterized protein YidB (DUF937 family)